MKKSKGIKNNLQSGEAMCGRQHVSGVQDVGSADLVPEDTSTRFHLHDAGVFLDVGHLTTDDTAGVDGADRG